MKYKLTCTDDRSEVTMSFEEVGLREVVAEIDRFLRAAGFYYNGSLDIVDYDDDYTSTPD